MSETSDLAARRSAVEQQPTDGRTTPASQAGPGPERRELPASPSRRYVRRRDLADEHFSAAPYPQPTLPHLRHEAEHRRSDSHHHHFPPALAAQQPSQVLQQHKQMPHPSRMGGDRHVLAAPAGRFARPAVDARVGEAPRPDDEFPVGGREHLVHGAVVQDAQALQRTAYVGNIVGTASDEDIVGFFAACGPMSYWRLASDTKAAQASNVSSKPCRFAIIEFTEDEGVENALALNGYLFHGRPVKVQRSSTMQRKPFLVDPTSLRPELVKDLLLAVAKINTKLGVHDPALINKLTSS